MNNNITNNSCVRSPFFFEDLFGIPSVITFPRKSTPQEVVGFRKNAAGAYFIHLEVPGMKPENLSIEQHEDDLYIKGEVKIGEGDELFTKSISERITLPEDADPDQISAKLTDGVLTIKIQPRTKSVPGTRKIEIQ